MIYLLSLLYWLAVLVAAVVLGAGREALLTPRVGALRAHQLGTLALLAVMLSVQWAMVRHLAPGATEAWAIGMLWTALLLAFEFGFFHYAQGVSWSELLAQWDVRRGHLWPLVPLLALLGPVLLRRLA